MYDVEGRHWWYRGMRRINRALLRRYLTPGRHYDLLDAGCGTGGSTRDLTAFGTVTGLDFSTDALSFAAKRGLTRLVQGSVEQLPFPDASFDVVTSFDVIYHRAVQDERAALREARRVLRPGGLALIRIPAFDWLRGAHDVVIHTERRLTVGQLAERVRQAGLSIEYATYGNTLLFPVALAKRLADSVLPGAPADLSVPPSPVNRLLTCLLTAEAGVAGRVPLPVGLSSIVVGRA
jgi:ubiquinone/menaquinone biosynthesis C-methylase UbiE